MRTTLLCIDNVIVLILLNLTFLKLVTQLEELQDAKNNS